VHETVRRSVCRATFVALCLAPTTAIAMWGLWRHLPTHTSGYRAALSQQFGMRAELTAVRHPQPGVELYEGVSLFDRETNALVLRCRVLEVSHDGDSARWTAEQLEMDAEHCLKFWELVSRYLEREWATAPAQVQLAANTVTLRIGEERQTIADVRGRLHRGEPSCEAELAFRIEGAEDGSMAKLSAVRATEQGPAVTTLSFDTGGIALPCRVFAPLFDAVDPLGPESRFAGTVRAALSGDDWRGEVAGSLEHVELDRLVTARFPHTLDGIAQVDSLKCVFAGGRVTAAAGEVRGGKGRVSRSLLQAGSEWLGLRGFDPGLPHSAGPTTEQMAFFHRLAFDFMITPDGLVLTGRCTEQPGAMLVDSTRVFWTQPAVQPQPVVNLVRVLVPQSEVQVPATAETETLLRHLPLAEIVRPTREFEPVPTARLRLGVSQAR